MVVVPRWITEPSRRGACVTCWLSTTMPLVEPRSETYGGSPDPDLGVPARHRRVVDPQVDVRAPAHGGDRLGQHVPRAVDLHPALGLGLRRRRVLLLLLLAGRAPTGLLRRRLAVRVVPALVVAALAGRRRAPAGLGTALPLRGRAENPTARAAAPGSAAARAAGRRGPGDRLGPGVHPGPADRPVGRPGRGRLAVGVVALGLALHLRTRAPLLPTPDSGSGTSPCRDRPHARTSPRPVRRTYSAVPRRTHGRVRRVRRPGDRRRSPAARSPRRPTRP